jgi:hypothetical protein
MDSQELSVALAVAYVPPLVWLLCGALIGFGKRTWNRLEAESSISDKDESSETASVIDILLSVLFDFTGILVDTILNIARVAVSYLYLLILFGVCFGWSVLFLKHSTEIIFLIDTVYEAFRPNLVETALQVLNFSRVVFALLIGCWNALIDILLLPIRLLFDSAFQCGGVGFIKQVAATGADVIKEFSQVLFSFFTNWKEDNILEMDITSLVGCVRVFLHSFTDVIECSCETVNTVMVRTVAYPLWSNTTDVFLNNGTRALLQAFAIPYTATTTGTVSFEPFFEIVLGEETGVFASAAALANEYFDAVLSFVQTGIVQSERFETPPIFSILHRLVAMPTETTRVVIKTLSALPTLVSERPADVADSVNVVASMYQVKNHANKFSDAVFVDTMATFHTSLVVYGNLFTTAAHLVTESTELLYNFTIVFAAGVSNQDSRAAPDRSSIDDCSTEIRFSENIVSRGRYSLLFVSDRYSRHIVPLQIQWGDQMRIVFADKLESAALGESLFAGVLSSIHTIDFYLKTGAYFTDALLRMQPVSHACVHDFEAPSKEKIDDWITGLPNIFTSFMALDDTNDSRYANLVCARSTHVNHVYSGSLKAYIFASKACSAKYDGTNVMPKCSYRHSDSEEQAKLCKHLIAFADYNTNPLCTSGDVLTELLRSLMIIIRTWEEYKNGMAIAIFNCVVNTASDIGNQNVWLQCASELSAEMIPSKTIFDLMECEIAEILYRASVSLTSFWTPLLDVVYNSIGYPSDGYYAKGVDDLHHVQARPFEAAFTTVLTAFTGILYYPVHIFADCGRDLIDMLNAFRSGTIDIFAVRKYRYTVSINVIRSVILFFRDGIIAITEFARVADTVDNYRKQVASDPMSADPKIPSSSFVEAQRTITSLVSLIQDIANLLSEEFMRGVEAFFDCLFSLMNALMTFEADDMVKFFEKLVEELAKVLSSVVEGIFKMLIAPFEGPIPNPFRFMFCDVMGALKDGTCEFLQAKFIPKSFQFECMSTKNYGPSDDRKQGKCSWIPSALNNEIPFFITNTLVGGITTGVVDKSDENTGDSGWFYGDAVDPKIGRPAAGAVFTPGNAAGVNGIGTSAAEAYTKFGFNWDPSVGGRFNAAYSALTTDNAVRTSSADFKNYCDFVIDDGIGCEEINEDSTLDFFASAASIESYWATKRRRCERPKKCDDVTAINQTMRENPIGCQNYRQTCNWRRSSFPTNPVPGVKYSEDIRSWYVIGLDQILSNITPTSISVKCCPLCVEGTGEPTNVQLSYTCQMPWIEEMESIRMGIFATLGNANRDLDGKYKDKITISGELYFRIGTIIAAADTLYDYTPHVYPEGGTTISVIPEELVNIPDDNLFRTDGITPIERVITMLHKWLPATTVQYDLSRGYQQASIKGMFEGSCYSSSGYSTTGTATPQQFKYNLGGNEKTYWATILGQTSFFSYYFCAGAPADYISRGGFSCFVECRTDIPPAPPPSPPSPQPPLSNLQIVEAYINFLRASGQSEAANALLGTRSLDNPADVDAIAAEMQSGGSKRRRILGGAADFFDPVGDAFEDAANAAARAATKAVEPLVDAANDIAKSAERLANEAKDAIVDQANAVANSVNNVINWVEDAIDEIMGAIPTKFSVQVDSIASVAGIKLGPRDASDTDLGMQCRKAPSLAHPKGEKQESFALCDITNDENEPAMEPTVCASEHECEAIDAACWTPDSSACSVPFDDDDVKWAKSCPCESVLPADKFHCNFASGFCEVGVTPFAPPMDSCSTAGGLVYGSDGYNRLCYISPLWKCANAENKTLCRQSLGDAYPLEGPSLCRAFCDPTFENRNNRLVQYAFSDGRTKCVCEVGTDRVFPTVSQSSESSTIFVSASYEQVVRGKIPVAGRRKLQSADDGETGLFTRCTSGAQCAPSFEAPKSCRSLWGRPIPCYSCSERVHNVKTGFACDPIEKECVCTVTRDNEEGESHLVDIGEWRGNSWCDKIMRGYKTTSVRSPLERAWIHRCSVLKALGETVVSFVGIPTIPPDILYNPARILSIAADAIEGVYTYYSENFDASDIDARIEFFDRLIERKIDPLVTLTVLREAERAIKIVEIIYSRVNTTGVIRSVLKNVSPAASDYFEEGILKTANVVNKTIDVARHTNYSQIFIASVASVKSIRNITAAALDATKTNSTELRNAHNETMTIAVRSQPISAVEHEPSQHNTSVEFPDKMLLRKLESLNEDCLVIFNLKERVFFIGDFLTNYYGSQDDYLGASLCSYDNFLTGNECPMKKGQSIGQEIDFTDTFPVFEFEFSYDQLKQSAHAIENWVTQDTDYQVKKIIDFTSKLSVSATKCDSDVMLCKKRKRSFIAAMWIVEGWAILIFLLSKSLGINSLGLGLFISAQFTVVPAFIMNLAYAFPLSCFPRMPVCVGDDLFDLTSTIFPTHISWPSEVVSGVIRDAHPLFPWLQVLNPDTHIEKCTNHNFNNIFDAFFWFKSYFGGGDFFAFVEWPLLRFVSEAEATNNKWKSIKLDDVINQCGLLNVVGVVPPVLASFFFYVTISFLAMPMVRLGASFFLKTKNGFKMRIMTLLDIYST